MVSFEKIWHTTTTCNVKIQIAFFWQVSRRNGGFCDFRTENENAISQFTIANASTAIGFWIQYNLVKILVSLMKSFFFLIFCNFCPFYHFLKISWNDVITVDSENFRTGLKLCFIGFLLILSSYAKQVILKMIFNFVLIKFMLRFFFGRVYLQSIQASKQTNNLGIQWNHWKSICIIEKL